MIPQNHINEETKTEKVFGRKPFVFDELNLHIGNETGFSDRKEGEENEEFDDAEPNSGTNR